MFLPAQLFVAAFPEIFSFSQLSVWMSWHSAVRRLFTLSSVAPLCCCVYFQTLRASPLTLNHLRFCKKKNPTEIVFRLLAGCSKSTAEHWDFNRPAQSFIPDFLSCPKQPLCSDEVPNIELTLKLMAKDPHPALVGPSQTSRPWCSISSANGHCSRPTLGYFTSPPPVALFYLVLIFSSACKGGRKNPGT